MKIKDIAQMAGVSPAAVSRYQHGGPLSAEKRERIRRVIEETGYRPSVMGQELRTGRANQIGVIVPSMNSGAVGEITNGIAARLSDTPYLIVLGNGGNDSEKEMEYFSALQSGRASGIILMGTTYSEAYAEVFKTCKLPLVVTGQRFSGVRCVYYDNRGASYALCRHLLEKGVKRIAFIGVSISDPAVGIDRKRGVTEAMIAYGLDPSEMFCYTGPFRTETGARGIEEMLRQKKEYDAVICATDMIALGAMKSLKEHRVRIPDDIRLAGFGDSWAGQIVTPTLTTIRFNHHACGEAAADLLLQMMEGEKTQIPEQVLIDYELIERSST